MKKIIIGLGALVVAIIIICSIVPKIMFNNVKEKVIENNPQIEQIKTIHGVGAWGEWYSEFVLEVEIDGDQFRIWTNDNGEITDQESLS